MARTPSSEAHEKVLEAAIQLIGERGIESASMDAIARLAGVSKATVYNHWKDKDALCVDVVNRLRVAPPEFRSGDPKRDLLSLLTHLAQANRSARMHKLLPRIVGYAAANPRFAEAMKRNSLGPIESQILRILDEGVSQGVLPASMDLQTGLLLLLGPIMYCRMTRGKVPPNLAAEVLERFWGKWP